MSDNPLENTPEREAALKTRAEQLWREAGSPAGRMDEFRERADELMRMELAGNAGQLPNPMTTDAPIPGVVVEEAAIQTNLGEFPGGSSVADQGEWRETPMTRDELRHGGDVDSEKGRAP
ncbi:MAG: hypothetical protein NVSMB18_35300 [Acetobacteraceae bacterium]